MPPPPPRSHGSFPRPRPAHPNRLLRSLRTGVFASSILSFERPWKFAGLTGASKAEVYLVLTAGGCRNPYRWIRFLEVAAIHSGRSRESCVSGPVSVHSTREHTMGIRPNTRNAG